MKVSNTPSESGYPTGKNPSIVPDASTDSMCQNFGATAIVPKSVWNIPIHYAGCPLTLMRWTLLRTEMFCWPFLTGWTTCWPFFKKRFSFCGSFLTVSYNFPTFLACLTIFLSFQSSIYAKHAPKLLAQLSICTECPLKILAQRQICAVMARNIPCSFISFFLHNQSGTLWYLRIIFSNER